MKKKWKLGVIGCCICLTVTGIPAVAAAPHPSAEDLDDPGWGRLSGNDISGDFYGRESRLDASGYTHDERFEGCTVRNGIDVSKFQNQAGDIDWNKVKNDGVEFVFVRAAYRGTGSGSLNEDPYVDENIQGALDAGLQVGVYIFSQAITEDEARDEAQFLMDTVEGYDIELPYVMDFEYAGSGSGRLYEADLTDEEATDVCRAFCDQITDAGYEPMLYANKNMLEQSLNPEELTDECEVWLARYNESAGYDGEYNFWQYSSSGQVDGIEGNVDMNFWYDGTVELRKIDGKWYYYANGQQQSDYEGLLRYNNSWYYIKDGVWQQDYEGLAQYDSGSLYYVKDGLIRFYYSGLYKFENKWYYIKDGRWDSSYSGMTKYTSGNWYYVSNGIMNKETGLVRHTSGVWYYVENGRWQSDKEGLVKYKTGSWYYVSGGKMQSSFEGLVAYGTHQYYVNNGKWQKNFDGTVTLDGVEHVIENGLEV